jgi:outer membrane protein assembly factor BamB
MRQAVLILPVAVLLCVGAGADWPGFLGPQGDGKSGETSILLDWPDAGPPVRWHMPVGEGYSMPSVAGARLFVFDRHGDRARLTRVDAESGKEIWRSEYPTRYEDAYGFSNGPRTSPVIDGGRVYTFGVEGRLRCHGVADGKLLWEVDTAKRFGVVQNFFGVGSTPVVEGDLLIAQIGGSPADSPAAQSGKVQGAGSGIVAFDKRTGKVRYEITDELSSYSSPVLRTIGDRRWAFVFARGGLVGFEPATGKVDFQFPWRAKKVESVNAASPVVVGDTVFVTESYGPGAVLLKVRPGGYEILRQDRPDRSGRLRSHWPTPIHHDGFLYGCSGSGSSDAELRAVGYLSGELAWSKGGLGRSTLLYIEGHFVVLTEYGELLLIRATPEKFDPVARVVLEGAVGPAGTKGPLVEHPAWNAPILSNGLLYVRGKNRLVCLDLNKPPT